MENNFLSILEDANAGPDRFSSFEDGNMREVEVQSVEKIIVKSASGINKTNNYYSLLLTEEVSLAPGQRVIYEYIDKEGIEDNMPARKNQTLTVMSCDGDRLKVVTKAVLEESKVTCIELNSTKTESQQDNLNFPGNIFVSDVEYGKVRVQFEPKESDGDYYVVAYREADARNDEWEYVATKDNYCWLEGVKREEYYVRVMYVKGDDFCFFSNEELLCFY